MEKEVVKKTVSAVISCEVDVVVLHKSELEWSVFLYIYITRGYFLFEWWYNSMLNITPNPTNPNCRLG